MNTLHTRRDFLGRGLTVLSAACTMPVFLQKTASAMSATAEAARMPRNAPRGDDTILVVIQLAGGNDGLATVVPLDNDAYRRARPNLVGPGHTLSLGAHEPVALHPNLVAFKSLYDAGHLAVIQGVGYPNPNRSHFRSAEIWETAEPAKLGTTGWLGRYFDAQCKGADPINPEAAINVGPMSPETLKGDVFSSVSFEQPEMFQWICAKKGVRDAKGLRLAFEELNDIRRGSRKRISTGNDTLDFLERTAMDAELSSETIRAVTEGHRGGIAYPATPLGRSLRLVAEMIAGKLATRVYYVTLGGFDTHVHERATHDALMKTLSDGVAAFTKDLQAQGNFDRAIIMTFSEFGRRVAENASQGTDHGTAAPMFVFGGGVKAGLYGKQPSLEPGDLDHGDLRFNTDFRNVYATILEKWLRADSHRILGGGFAPLKFIA